MGKNQAEDGRLPIHVLKRTGEWVLIPDTNIHSIVSAEYCVPHWSERQFRTPEMLHDRIVLYRSLILPADAGHDRGAS
jgi:hypothetical protein